MSRNLFKYTAICNDFFKADYETSSGYLHFGILDAETGELLDEIITNGSGCGRWVPMADGTFRQVRGTCQYAVPRTAQGLKKALRNDLRDTLLEKQMQWGDGKPVELTEREQQYMDVLCQGKAQAE